ncbi:hypothetical protein BDK51DRAFT_30278, partial [Blyttiomyces helicus]
LPVGLGISFADTTESINKLRTGAWKTMRGAYETESNAEAMVPARRLAMAAMTILSSTKPCIPAWQLWLWPSHLGSAPTFETDNPFEMFKRVKGEWVKVDVGETLEAAAGAEVDSRVRDGLCVSAGLGWVRAPKVKKPHSASPYA